MGLCIRGKHKNSIEINGGYTKFMIFRNTIAFKLDKEFGKHYDYARKLSIIAKKEDWEKFDNKTQMIISHERFKDKDDVIEFLFMTDCDGKINYKTCKQLLDILNNDLPYKFTNWQEEINLFKELLQECYSKRSNLVWG